MENMAPSLDILTLNSFLNPENEEDSHLFGSAITPGSLQGKKDKEIAKPNAKVEVKTFNRAIGGGATEDSLKEEERKQKANDPKNQIWTA